MTMLFVFPSESERDKFEFIFHKYKKLMLHKAYGILRDYSLAEDAASEAFIRIYKNLHKIDDPESNRAVAFIITIVKNVSLTMLKQYKTVAVEEYDYDLPDSFDLEQHTISQLNAEYIYHQLDELGDELKSVFLLKYAYDLSHKEIGKMLGISENNVTVRLHRAKKKLAAMLQSRD